MPPRRPQTAAERTQGAFKESLLTRCAAGSGHSVGPQQPCRKMGWRLWHGAGCTSGSTHGCLRCSLAVHTSPSSPSCKIDACPSEVVDPAKPVGWAQCAAVSQVARPCPDTPSQAAPDWTGSSRQHARHPASARARARTSFSWLRIWARWVALPCCAASCSCHSRLRSSSSLRSAAQRPHLPGRLHELSRPQMLQPPHVGSSPGACVMCVRSGFMEQ